MANSSFYVYDVIVDSNEDAFGYEVPGVAPMALQEALERLTEGDTLNLFVNSPGGSVFAASSMCSMIQRAQQKKREEEAQKHQQAVDEYVKKVKAGTITLDAVPEEYRAEVDAIVNPAPEPPTLKEITTQLEAAQEAIDFLMMNSITE